MRNLTIEALDVFNIRENVKKAAGFIKGRPKSIDWSDSSHEEAL